MKHTQRNLIYHTEFDGIIFKYSLNSFWGSIFSFMGYTQRLEIPLNVVLNYRAKRRLGFFQSLEFTVYRHNYHGTFKLKRSELKGLLFTAFSTSRFGRLLKRSLDRNIEETKEGKNLALSYIPIETIKRFYKSKDLVDEEKIGKAREGVKIIKNDYPEIDFLKKTTQ